MKITSLLLIKSGSEIGTSNSQAASVRTSEPLINAHFLNLLGLVGALVGQAPTSLRFLFVHAAWGSVSFAFMG